MFHVLEHLYDPRAYLIAAHKLLAPALLLVVQVPNAASWDLHLLNARGTVWMCPAICSISAIATSRS